MSMTPPTLPDLDAMNAQLENADATRVARWAHETFGDGLVLTTSFGAQSAVMLHLVTEIVPDIVVIWIDTGFNFPETYQFSEQLIERFKLNLKVYQSQMSPARMVALHGRLWEQEKASLDRYDQIRKVEPLERAFKELDVRAWLTGIRRDQTDLRRTQRTVERHSNTYKIHPILEWPSNDVGAYLKRHGLPYHPLVEKGYPSIGDWHSTTNVTGDMGAREGRFRGLKQECGLHIPQTPEENESRESSGL